MPTRTNYAVNMYFKFHVKNIISVQQCHIHVTLLFIRKIVKIYQLVLVTSIYEQNSTGFQVNQSLI